MPMDNKISTHKRFISKFERDLKSYFDQGEDNQYVQTYRKYIELTEPSDYLEELYYEALLNLDAYHSVIDHALMRMNRGLGNYETHMDFMLEALTGMGRFQEVIEYCEQLLKEDLPHEFRLLVQQRLGHARHELNVFYREPVKRDKVTKKEYQGYDFIDKIEFLEDITELTDISYKSLILDEIKTETEPMVYTQMLLYLRSINDNDKLKVKKFNISTTVVPAKLPSLEDFYLVNEVLDELYDILDATNPSIKDAAENMLYGHLLYIYPIKPKFTNHELALAYAQYLQEMLGQESVEQANQKAVKWIEKIDRFMLENEQ